MADTWGEILNRGQQRAITTGRTGQQGTGFMTGELEELRRAELESDQKTAFQTRQQELNQKNIENNFNLQNKAIESQSSAGKWQLGTYAGGMALQNWDKLKEVGKAGIEAGKAAIDWGRGTGQAIQQSAEGINTFETVGDFAQQYSAGGFYGQGTDFGISYAANVSQTFDWTPLADLFSDLPFSF